MFCYNIYDNLLEIGKLDQLHAIRNIPTTTKKVIDKLVIFIEITSKCFDTFFFVLLFAAMLPCSFICILIGF